MMKHQHWEKNIESVTDGVSKRRFKWGEHDCVRTAAIFVFAVARKNPGWEKFDYDDETKARARVDAEGGALEGIVERECEKHGLLEVPVYKAQRGDLVWLNTSKVGVDPWGGATGIVDLSGQQAITVHSNGIVRASRKFWRRAWRVS